MADVLQRIRDHWLHEGAGLAVATATPAEIATWEQRYSVFLPDDLRAYAIELNGTRDAEALEFGNGLTSFFPLQAMIPEHEFNENFDSTNLFVFADYLISSHWWLAEITKQRRERTRVFVRGTKLKLVSESLDEFLSAYIAGAHRIHPS